MFQDMIHENFSNLAQEANIQIQEMKSSQNTSQEDYPKKHNHQIFQGRNE